MPKVEINGFEMHYEIRGEGQPLLLLHGGMGIGGDWRYVFPADPADYRVIVPDLRGHGQSTSPAEGFTFRACADHVRKLLDHLKLERIKASGKSMGAKTLLHLATAHTSLVDAMVLVSGTPRFPDSLRAAASQFTRAAFATLSSVEVETLRARHVHGDEQILKLYDMTCSFATSYDDMAFTAAGLGTITARTLIVHGDRDALYPVELAVELFRGIPASALWIVPNGGHGPVFGGNAATFRSAALSFLGT